MNTPRARLWAAALLLALCIVLPRAPALGRFVTADEHAWLARSGNFYYALAHRDWAGTFQRHHPGVTVTWAGLAGYLLTYPGYAADAPGQFGWLTEEVEPFLRARGHDPLEVLAAGRGVVVAIITLALLASFGFARRLLGLAAALLGVGLIGLAPFHIAHSRLLHLDGLMSSLMLLSLLAWLDYLVNPRWRALTVAAVAAGLAWLTRSPALFLLPWLGLVTLICPARTLTWQTRLRGLLIGGLGGLAVFVLIWPAMWVAPVGSLRQVLTAAGDYAAEGHLKPTFFNGGIYAGDPGFWFYPITYLWRSTPVTWIGLFLALVGAITRWPPLDDGRARRVTLTLLLYALAFMLFMNIGAKKFDRYVLPSHVALEMVAGVGWAAALGGLARRVPASALRYASLALGALTLAAQALLALPTYPYYLTYYNPLLGGSKRAPEVMMIGWGEGADVAGRYLNAKTDAADLRVASGYTNGPLSYFFRGTTLPLTFWHDADYAAVFIQDRQRQLPSRRSAAYFQRLTPEYVVRLDGIDYAHVYDLRDAPLPDYVTDFATDRGSAIRLVTFQLPAATIQPGETVRAIFYLVNLAPIDTNLNVLVRVVGPGDVEIARAEGWPWGAATSGWQQGVVWPDGHDLTIPRDTPPGYYRVELGFYDPATQELLPAVQTATGAPLGDLVTVDALQVGELPDAYGQTLTPPVLFGDDLALQGVDWQQADGTSLAPGAAITAGTSIEVALTWQAQDWIDTSYTAFVHWVGPDGTLAAQMDKPPLDGFLPTNTWAPNQRVRDTFTLTLPPAAAAGDYTLYTGFYHLIEGADGNSAVRLPVTQGDEPLGDAFRLGTLHVR